MGERTIAVIGGTGDQGFGIVLRLAKAGEKVIIGSRQQQKADDAAKRARSILGENCSVDGMENPKAAAAADIIIMSVPFAAHVDMIKSVVDSITPEDIFVDVVVPLSTAVGGGASTALGVWEGSAAQQAMRLLPPRTKIASAFHNVVAEALQDLNRKVDCDVIVCSDTARYKKDRDGSSREGTRGQGRGWRALGELENSRTTHCITHRDQYSLQGQRCRHSNHRHPSEHMKT